MQSEYSMASFKKKALNKHRIHRNVLYVLCFILIISQLSSFIFLGLQISKTQVDLEKTKFEIKKEISSSLEEYTRENQKNLNELTQLVINQKNSFESFQEQVDLLKSSQGDFSDVIEKAVKGVVSVAGEKSAATGFAVSGNGYIVTNEHVISGSSTIKIMKYNREVLNANLIGIDKDKDLALLKVNSTFDHLYLADSEKLGVGNKVIAIGNPLGLSFSASEGIISGLDRKGPSGFNEYIQTDVSLNQGNSGGPLLDTSGRVVGINNFKIGGNAEGLGFALESNSIKETINNIANITIIE